MTTTATAIEPAELAGAMVQAVEQFLYRVEGKPKSDDSKPYIPANVWAGQFSPCAREMTLRMTKGHELPPFQAEQLARFRRGKDRARNIKADFEQAGRDSKPAFELVGAEERFEITWNGIVIITGKVDWKTKFNIPGLKPIPTELKDWSPFLTDRVEKFADLFDNKWTRKGAFQLLSYMYGMNQEFGLMVLARAGLPKILPVSLFANEDANLKRVDQFCRLAFEAVQAKNKDTLPDFVKDVEVCKSCDFLGSHCQPPLLSGQGAKVFTDEALAQALDRRGELEPAADEFDKLDKAVKKQLRGVEMGVAGDWLVEGKFGKQSKTVVPPEHKALYESWQETDPHGRFTLKLTRLGTTKETQE